MVNTKYPKELQLKATNRSYTEDQFLVFKLSRSNNVVATKIHVKWNKTTSFWHCKCSG